MWWLVGITVRLIRAGQRAYARKGAFAGAFALTFIVSAWCLGALGLLPDSPGASATAAATETPAAAAGPELPVAIAIPAIRQSATTINPDSVNVDVLDQALLKGAVRYPTSALLGEEGNVVLFGHSSYLPIVGNSAYRTFNDIQKLKPGDTIIVSSSRTAYTYLVRSVAKANVEATAIPLSVRGRVLTLSTCDSFAAKTDRFIVVADFVESHPISTL